MTVEEIISGLQFTVDMFLFDPFTGETLSEPRNDMDKITVDSCRAAIDLLNRDLDDDLIDNFVAYVSIEMCNGCDLCEPRLSDDWISHDLCCCVEGDVKFLLDLAEKFKEYMKIRKKGKF